MNKLTLILLTLIIFSCSKPDKIEEEKTNYILESGLNENELKDKILGMLVGSAIGDAMGAPTEMWARADINLQYGFVETLDSMIREVSPEGIWLPNLPAGGTTDDTRWKELTVNYLLSQSPTSLDSKDFAEFIFNQYSSYVQELKNSESIDPSDIEKSTLKFTWLQEWAKVSQPYIAGNVDGYADSLSRFYGGEMVCAGLLYAPAIGAIYPGNPEKAYLESYKLAIYDIGYARDLTALSAAMTAAGMKKGANKEDILAALRIDPKGYYQSRLVGRTAQQILINSLAIDQKAWQLDSTENRFSPDSEALKFAFSELDQRQQDMPFHAGEIYLQVLTAMLYADFDFQKTMVFLVNYGRDNDTTAAVAGGILGAHVGFEKLPSDSKQKVLKVSKEVLGIDLEKLADRLTQHLLT
ncbi:ADP-ribosylglycohydrolase family protein [Algoriphagus machipongonensis]|uniref:ADP-ribosylglycohydrolase superfamily n=1 Tax=Algoriphagus machipongonensis TaxID=388413 RepID=A3HRZ3_9BACT|nr:ADP-ribosylglycohydrolase family protein [Algoriphagus machipongonensis]EAZ82611.1 ADP-ribosylglycohydrolase superfamily [Algoriphagus machipongonensis]